MALGDGLENMGFGEIVRASFDNIPPEILAQLNFILLIGKILFGLWAIYILMRIVHYFYSIGNERRIRKIAKDVEEIKERLEMKEKKNYKTEEKIVKKDSKSKK